MKDKEKSCENCGNTRKHECLNAMIDSGFCRNAVGGWQQKDKSIKENEIRAEVRALYIDGLTPERDFYMVRFILPNRKLSENLSNLKKEEAEEIARRINYFNKGE